MFGIICLIKCSFIDCHVLRGQICNKMQKSEKQNSSGITYTVFTKNIFSKVTVYNAVTKFQMKTVTAKYTKLVEMPQAEDMIHTKCVKEPPVHIPALLLLSATSLDPSHIYETGTW